MLIKILRKYFYMYIHYTFGRPYCIYVQVHASLSVYTVYIWVSLFYSPGSCKVFHQGKGLWDIWTKSCLECAQFVQSNENSG